MKTLIIACISLFSVVALASLPEYQTDDYYVMSAPDGTNALHFINVSSGVFPFYGRNGKTGEVDPNAVTTCWVDSVKIRQDGKAVIPRIPPALLAHYNIPAAMMTYFVETFNVTVEQYQSDWFSEE